MPQVKPARRDLCKMRDQARALAVFLLGEDFGLMFELGRREPGKLCDEMRV